MGVPKFYRWISERYPKINEIISDSALLPEFDHLYLDMNGIIHGCTHPSDRDISDGLSERDMMLGIMHYLDRIITQIVKPKVSVYMAIDGVAPRAKLNQQRSRRFRSAMDMAEATKDMALDETTGRKADVFDSNCITPGTEFLARVSEHIQYFIRKKIKEDPAWHNLQVIFSGHDIPGEGEHKIMQHIRQMRAQPQYQPNTRHCIYGQDADLIMLGLVTHEPHFTILREIVDFGFGFQDNKNTLKAVKKFTKESDFQLLHLSVLREYIQIEFAYQQPEYDLERIVDDFVFMTFLVGNDFLPHMPTLDIGDGAFDLLFQIYKDQRVGWGQGQYLTKSGEISDPTRLEGFLTVIGEAETEILEQREKNDAVYLQKRRKWDKRDGKPEGPSDAALKEAESMKQKDYTAMIEGILTKHNVNDFVDGWNPVSETDAKDFKGRYYFEKMSLTPVDKKEHWALRKSYMEGLQWCLAYYYRGCISWGWFYPYHYGPMLSDLKELPKMFAEIKFELGEPLKPFQQLMGCLPPASLTLVPKLYRWLMTSTESPIIQFYPEHFEVDMNGKKNPWEGVNLLPFIDIKLLQDTVAAHCPDSKLSDAERKRNALGKVYCYRYDASCTDVVESPGKSIGLPDIIASHSSVKLIDEDLGLSKVIFEPKLVPGTQLPYPGFPSLGVIPIASVELAQIGLNCFGSPSKYPNMILTMHPMPELPPIEQLAENILGKSLFVNWPMMHESSVVAISDSSKEIRLKGGKPVAKMHSDLAAERWFSESTAMAQSFYTGIGIPGSGGIQIGEVRVRLKVLPLQGMKTNPSNGSTKKVFGKEEADVPLQLALWKAPAPDPRFVERGPLTLEDRFPENCSVVLTKGKYRGCIGSVIGVADNKNVGVKVLTRPPEPPFGLAIARSLQEAFFSSADAARILKIHPGVFGKITGRLQFEQGKYDLGLHLKTNDGMCVIGYTRKRVTGTKGDMGKSSAWVPGDSLLVVGSRIAGADSDEEDERIQWEYTPKAIRLVETYRNKFPQLFAALNKKPNERRYNAIDVFGPDGEAWLPVVREWLNKHESAKIPRSPVTTEAMSIEATAAVQKAADVRCVALKKMGFPKEVLVKVPGSALYREGSTGATDVLLAESLNGNERPELGDRVVNLCVDGVPFGARGTVIGIHEAFTTGSVEVVMDEEFIGGTSLQGHCSNFRGKLCPWARLLKIAPDNSQGLVDKLVPKGGAEAVSRKAIDGILSGVKKEAPMKLTTKPKPTQSMQVSSPSQLSATKTTPLRSSHSTTPPRASSRHGSTGRARQGAWREAKGPDKNGNGFKGIARGGKVGFEVWKSALNSKAMASRSKDTAAVENTAADLKRILGISAPASGPRGFPSSQPTTVAADQLKALLGVNSAAVGVPTLDASLTDAAPPTPHTAAGLKAPIGVQGDAAPHQPIRIMQRPSQSSSAADKILQMMAGKQSQGSGQNYSLPPQSGFNFTYVEEGKEPPPQQPQPMSPHFPNYPIPPPMPMQGLPVPGYGSSMPRIVFGTPPGPPPLPGPPAPFRDGPSISDFPPLGSKSSEMKPTVTDVKQGKRDSNTMVPSAIAGKARR